MNKKQALVTELIERISVLDITSDSDEPSETQLRADANFWENYPDGHCNSMKCPSIEGLLSCLTEESLQAIVDKDYIEPGKSFNSVWGEWGRAGYLKSMPEIIKDKYGTPILRLRHDCYLHQFKDYGFQNSYDAYCNVSNGASPKALGRLCEAVKIGADNQEKWNKEWALFRKAMIVSYPAQACAGKTAFYKMLNEHSDVFDDFITLTDEKCMHLDLDPSMTWNVMKEQASKQKFNCSIDFEVPIMIKSTKEEKQQFCGILRFGKSAVSYTWCENMQSQSMCINFPKFGKNTLLHQQEYLLECWVNLGYTLLTMAGIACAKYNIALPANRKINVIDVSWTQSELWATNISTLNDVCSRGLREALTR